MNNAPIALFDSGFGGLSVWSEFYRAQLNESLIYYGDGKNCPYGTKSTEEVIGYIHYAIERLVNRGVKLVVLACNTATSLTIKDLRAKYSIPFVGMEPAIKPAVEATKSGVVAVLATKATLNGKYLQESQLRYGDRAKIILQEGTGLVELVENGMEESAEAERVVASILLPLLEQGADQIVLGCTHYPFLTRAMQKVIGGDDVRLVNPANAIKKQALAVLQKNALEADPNHQPIYDFMTSWDELYKEKIIAKSKIILEIREENPDK